MQSKTKTQLVGEAIHNLWEPFSSRDVAKETGLHARACSQIMRSFEDELDREEVSRSHGYRYRYRLKETEAKKLKMKTRKGVRDVLMYLTQENLDELLRVASELQDNQYKGEEQ